MEIYQIDLHVIIVNLKSSDLTIWDCFTVENFDKRLDDDKGTTRILVQSQKGNELFENIKDQFNYKEVPVDKLVKNVKEMYNSVSMNSKRKEFFKDINNMEEKVFFNKYFPNSLKVRTEKMIRKNLAKTKIYKTTKKVIKKILRKG